MVACILVRSQLWYIPCTHVYCTSNYLLYSMTRLWGIQDWTKGPISLQSTDVFFSIIWEECTAFIYWMKRCQSAHYRPTWCRSISIASQKWFDSFYNCYTTLTWLTQTMGKLYMWLRRCNFPPISSSDWALAIPCSLENSDRYIAATESITSSRNCWSGNTANTLSKTAARSA